MLKKLIRYCLYKVTKSDFLVLNPEWELMGRASHMAVAGARCPLPLLGVKYNYHVESDCILNYEIAGKGSGKLGYQLCSVDGVPLVTVEVAVNLPCKLTINLADSTVALNDVQVASAAFVRADSKLSRLVGDFLFTSNDSRSFARKTDHLLENLIAQKQKHGAYCSEIDESYYHGAVYEDYETDASYVPQAILRAIGPYVRSGDRVLDIGCATGTFVQAAAEAGFDAVGVDVSEWAVSVANARTGGRCSVASFEDIEKVAGQGRFQATVMHSVIEHLRDPESAIKGMGKLLLPGGIAYVQTLNADSLTYNVAWERLVWL